MFGTFQHVRMLPGKFSWDKIDIEFFKIGRAHVWTPVTDVSRMPSSAWKKKKKKKNKKKEKKNKIKTTQI